MLLVGEGFLISVNDIEYLVDKDGKVNDGNKVEVSNIENAGDLSKGGQYDGLTEETAYRITCIEDLVEWTNNYNNYKNKNIKLENTIDFNSIGSYKNHKSKSTDINGNGTIEELITELTTGMGFKPIIEFSGIFDGQENEIRNIYENRSSEASLFIRGAHTIKNVTLTGNIISSSHAAGISLYSSKLIENCINKANITGFNIVAGIAARDEGCTLNIKNCKNYGDIKITGQSYAYTGAGGICTVFVNSIENCVNYGKLSGQARLGGILACACNDSKVIKCINYGKIEQNYNNDAGGIIGYHRYGDVKLISNINYGEVGNNGRTGGVVGLTSSGDWNNIIKLTILNCANYGKIHSNSHYTGGIIGNKDTICKKNVTLINNCFNAGEITASNSNKAKTIVGYIGRDTTENYYHELYNVYGTGNFMGAEVATEYNKGEASTKTLEEMKTEAFVDLLNINVNTYNEEHKNEEGFVQLNKWKYNVGNYPTFE